MKLNSLTIENFRCFEQIHLTLHPQLTVLIAPNGAGKTTLLDAARIAVWPFVKAFDLASQTGKSATIQIEDVRGEPNEQGDLEPRIPAVVMASGQWSAGQSKTWEQWRDKLKVRTKAKEDVDTKGLEQYAQSLQNKVFTAGNAPFDLPLVAYLGTGRLWYQGRYNSTFEDKKLEKSVFSRTWGYKDCLAVSSSYKQFEDWFGWIYLSYREMQLDALENQTPFDQSTNHFKQAIDVVVNAVNSITKAATGWGDIAYRSTAQKQIVLQHPQHGIMPLSLLSDGLRNAVVMVADLAFRCSKLNPHYGAKAAFETGGVVMIDEVDMFLHPAWQQTILQSLQDAFPKVQFIVTTHSPQVLTTCKAEQIRVLESTPQGIKVHEP
ncbi:MAG: putative ATP-binding protein involved in virulence, partial [Alteromonadaceae bacterium]